MMVYRLLVEDMTTLGAMGSSPTTISRDLYSTSEKARAAAAEHYDNEIAWTRIRTNYWSSGDLRYVMYSVTGIEVL